MTCTSAAVNEAKLVRDENFGGSVIVAEVVAAVARLVEIIATANIGGGQ